MRVLVALIFCFWVASVSAKNHSDSLYKDFLAMDMHPEKFNKGFDLFWKWVYTNPPMAGKVATDLKGVAEAIERTAFIAQSYNVKGIYFDVTSKQDSAVLMYKKALQIIEPHDSLHKLKGSYLNNIGLVFAAKGANDSAFFYYSRALEEARAYDNLKFRGNITHNIGIALKRQGRVKEAVRYYRKGIKIGKERDDVRFTAQLYHSMSEVFSAQRNYDSALHFVRKAIGPFKEANDRFRLGMAYHNLGAYLRVSQHSDSSYFYLKQSLRIQRSLNDRSRASSSAHMLSEHYGNDGNADSARKYLEIAAEYVDTTNLGRYSIFLDVQGLIEHLEGQHDKSFNTMLRSQQMRDSSHIRNYRSEVAAVQESLNLKMKEQEIEKLEAKNALTQEKSKNQKTVLIGAISLLLLVVVIGIVVYNRTQLKHKNALTEKELEFQEKANFMTIETQEEERQRIAQELHDDIGQQLTAIKMGWNNFFKENKQNESAEKLQKNLDELAEDVRTLSHRMMPKALVQLGLQAAIEDLVNKHSQQSGVEAHFEYFNLKERYEGRIEKTLYRIAQEALNNIVKHARATEINVQLYGQETWLTMMVEDNGQGFISERTTGKGLFNMENRAKLLKGEVNIESSPEQGTVVFVRIPV